MRASASRHTRTYRLIKFQLIRNPQRADQENVVSDRSQLPHLIWYVICSHMRQDETAGGSAFSFEGTEKRKMAF